MYTTVAIVNTPPAQILQLASFRTIYTIARYNTVHLYKSASKAQIADILAAALTTERAETRAASLLNAGDILTLYTLCQHTLHRQEEGEIIVDLPIELTMSGQTHFPRTLYNSRSQPLLDQLTPIERLMVLGFVIPINMPSRNRARLLIHTAAAKAASWLHTSIYASPQQQRHPHVKSPDKPDRPTLPLTFIAGDDRLTIEMDNIRTQSITQ